MLSETIAEAAPETIKEETVVQEITEEITEPVKDENTVVDITTTTENETISSGAKKQIFCGNIPFASTEEDVKEYFEKFGTISELLLAKKKQAEGAGHRGFAFISYVDMEISKIVLNTEEHKLGGRILTVNKAKPKKVKFFVGGLDREKTDQESLRTFFSQYGEITDCFCPNKKKFGFVTMVDDGSNVKTILEQGSFEIDGSQCDVKTAQPKREERSEGRGGMGHGMYHNSPPAAYGYGHGFHGSYGMPGGRQHYNPYGRPQYPRGGYGGAYGGPRHY